MYIIPGCDNTGISDIYRPLQFKTISLLRTNAADTGCSTAGTVNINFYIDIFDDNVITFDFYCRL